MQLRARLLVHGETISDFAVSASQKYVEGMELATAGHRGAAIYLMGFSAEMLLKLACFRFDGARPADPIAPRLAPARSWMARVRPAIPHEGYHSLWFWCVYLRERRTRAGAPLPASLAGELSHRVRRLYQIWWVEMRYRPDAATEVEVERVYRDLTWLHQHARSLWR